MDEQDRRERWDALQWAAEGFNLSFRLAKDEAIHAFTFRLDPWLAANTGREERIFSCGDRLVLGAAEWLIIPRINGLMDGLPIVMAALPTWPETQKPEDWSRSTFAAWLRQPLQKGEAATTEMLTAQGRPRHRPKWQPLRLAPVARNSRRPGASR